MFKKNIVRKLIMFSLFVLTLAIFAGALIAAVQVVEDPCGTTVVYNKPVPNSEFKAGDDLNFSGKLRVTSCGDGLFFNRITFYIAEDKDIPITVTTTDGSKYPLNYGNCFGATSSIYGSDCSGIKRGDQVQILDLSKGYKIRKLGTIYPPDIFEYDGEGGFNWIEYNKNFTVPSDLGFDGDVRFYVEYSGAHWNTHWHWLTAYQKGEIIPAPQAKIVCDNSQCGSGSGCSPIARAYEPIAKPSLCFYVLRNKSKVSGLEESNWYVKPAGSSDGTYEKKLSCGSLCDYVLQKDMPAGNTYTVKLEVKDKYGQSDNATIDVYVASEIKAEFKCAISSADLVWRDCKELSHQIARGGKMCLKDISRPSDGAAINSWQWMINDKIAGNEEEICFNAESVNRIRLTVSDSKGRSDYSEDLVNAKPIPKWEEVAP